MFNFLIIPFQAITARMSGGGLYASKMWSRLPELMFALPFAYATYMKTGLWYVALISYIVSFFTMELGHGTFYKMTGYVDANRDPDKADKPRIQSIEVVFRPIYKILGGDIYSPLYSWFMMAIKGSLIALPLVLINPILVLALAILWPFSYWICIKVDNNAEMAELFSGMMAGIVVYTSFLLM